MANRFLPLLAAVFLLACCIRPASYESFIRASDSEDGLYEFALDMADSTSLFDLSFYTSVAGVPGKDIVIPLTVEFVSPSGKDFSEQVFMKLESEGGSKSMYRSGMAPSEFGEWTLRIRTSDDSPEITGMGIILERNGTR